MICSIFAATAITANAQTPDLNVHNQSSASFTFVAHGENTGCGFTYKSPMPVPLAPGPNNVHYIDVSAAGLVDGGGTPISPTGNFTYVQITPDQGTCSTPLPSTIVGDCGTTTTNISAYDATCGIITVNIHVSGGNVHIQ